MPDDGPNPTVNRELQEADYGYDKLNEDIDRLHSRTSDLVAGMETLCASTD